MRVCVLANISTLELLSLVEHGCSNDRKVYGEELGSVSNLNIELSGLIHMQEVYIFMSSIILLSLIYYDK